VHDSLSSGNLFKLFKHLFRWTLDRCGHAAVQRGSSSPPAFDDAWRHRLRNYPATEEFRTLYEELKQRLPLPPSRLRAPVVVSFIGTPGSGKSTVAELLQEFVPAVHLCSDAVGLFRLAWGPNHDYYKAYVIQEALARHYLSSGYSVIMDDNCRTRHNRKQVYTLAQQYGATSVLFSLALPVKEAARRAQRRDVAERRPGAPRPFDLVLREVENALAQLEPPTAEELADFHVLHRRIRTDVPLAAVRELLREDAELRARVLVATRGAESAGSGNPGGERSSRRD